MDSSQTPAPVFISKETTLRLLRDVREMMTVPEEGIFYKHSETDMLCGYALIIGPKALFMTVVIIFTSSSFLRIIHILRRWWNF